MKRKLWQEIGHWTICSACEDLRIDLKDYAIHHHRFGNRNTLEVWQGRDRDRVVSYAECELVYSATWISGSPMISTEAETFNGHTHQHCNQTM